MAKEGLNNKRTAKRRAAKKLKPKLGELTLAEFRSVFGKIKSLGLTWTADIPPHLIAKEARKEAAIPSLPSMRIQEKYPTFPNELGGVVFYILTGERVSSLGGDKKLLEKKASVVRESELITESYRGEFFFKHAIKVPYFSDLDWEVVVKKYERNVRESPGVSYALLSLEFEGPRPGSDGKRRTVVAVNARITEKLLKILTELKEALAKSESANDILPEKVKSEGNGDALTNKTNLLADGSHSS